MADDRATGSGWQGDIVTRRKDEYSVLYFIIDVYVSAIISGKGTGFVGASINADFIICAADIAIENKAAGEVTVVQTTHDATDVIITVD